MSILETFYIMFKSDADKAAADMERVEDAADGVEGALNKADKSLRTAATSTGKAARSSKDLGTGYAGATVSANTTAVAAGKVAGATALADANAKRLSASFLGVAKTLAAPIFAVFSVKGVFDIATGRAEAIRELDVFSSKLNSSISDVDAFQRSIQQLGGDGSKALDSLGKIGEKVNEAFADSESGARKMFDAWGLSFKDAQGNALGATDAMLALATSLETVSRAEGLARIKKLGIEDATTINMLLKGREAVVSYMDAQKAVGVVTKEQAELATEYAQEIGMLGNKLTSFGNLVATAFLPIFIQGIGVLSTAFDWMSKNGTLVEGFFKAVGTAITVYYLPALWGAATAVVAATWPFLLMIAAVAALGVAFALAYEDFQAWANGQPSVLGELLGDYETFVASIQGLLDAFNWDNFLKDLAAIKNWFSDAFSIEGFLQDVDTIKKAFTDLGDWVKSTFGAAIEGVLSLITGIPGAVKAAITGIIMAGTMASPEQLQSAGQAGASFGASVIVPPGVSAGQGLISGASNAPQGLATPNASNRTSTVNVGTVTVNTQATDADGMARAAKQALQTELRGAASSFDDGVDR